MAGCSSKPLCPTLADELAREGDEVITCDDAWQAERYIEAVAAKPLSAKQEQFAYRALAKEASADFAGTKARLDAARAFVEGLKAGTPWQGRVKRRGREMYEVAKGRGLWPEDDFGSMYSLFDRVLKTWKIDDSTQLALGEMDIETWIHYASWCREAQSAGPLVVSMGDRLLAYRELVDRWETLPEEGKIAVIGLAPFWKSIEGKWGMATYAKQQRWITQVPLPGPMEGKSLDYFQAIIALDPVGQVSTTHDALGPFRWTPPQ